VTPARRPAGNNNYCLKALKQRQISLHSCMAVSSLFRSTGMSDIQHGSSSRPPMPSPLFDHGDKLKKDSNFIDNELIKNHELPASRGYNMGLCRFFHRSVPRLPLTLMCSTHSHTVSKLTCISPFTVPASSIV